MGYTWGMQHYYTVATHLAGSPQEYFMLRILDSKGDLIRVRTGKKISYIRAIIKAANLKRYDPYVALAHKKVVEPWLEKHR